MPTARRALARLAIAAVFAMRVEGAGALHGVVVRARPVLGHCLPTARPARRAARASAPVVCTLFSPAVFATSAGAVAELAVSAGLGYAAVRSGLLERSGVTQLARIVYNFFLPIFLFASVTRTVQTYGVSRGMLALPLVSAIQIACGLSVARLLLRALGISPALRSSRRFVTCAAFGNTGVLPLVLAEAIFRSPPYADATVLPRAASYLSFYLLGWSPIFWSLGKSILTGDGDVAAAGEPRWRQFARRVISPPIIGALGGLAFGLLCPSFVLESPRSPLRIVMQALRNIARAYPPAALLVLAGSLAGDAPVSAKAGPEQAAPMDAGRGADAQAPREMGMPTMLLGITAFRFVLSPLIALGLVRALSALRVLPSVSADPLLTFALLLNSAMPPAQNSVLMLQVAGDQKGATQMSRVLFVVYALAAVPISVLLSVFLQRVGL